MNAWPQTSRDRRWKHCAGWELLLVLVALITLAGCQGISIASKQTTTPSGAVSFGSVGVGASKTLTATATNHDTAAVTVASAVSTATQFSVTRHSLPQPTSPSTVAGSQNATLSITFTPSATGSSTGSFAGSFAITSAASDSPVTVSLFVTGTGFSLNGLNHPVTLAAGESVTFSVIFTPQSAGNASGNLVIASNASNRTLNIPLSGTGTTTGQLAVSPARLSLGNVEVGTSASVPATLSATGAGVTVYSVELSSSEFTLSGITFPTTITAGNSVQFAVKFTPQAAASASGNLVIASNASNRTLNIPLSGTGTTTGQLAVSPARLSLGNVEVGTSASVPATLSATGASVTVYSVELSSSEFTLSGITFPTTITAGNSVQFAVKFTPQAAASASGTASFSSNVSHSPAVLSWSGTGIPAPVASVTVTPSSTTIVTGKTQQFSATAKDARGNVITGVGFTWNSDAPWVATVDTNGLATAANQGTARITARASGATGSVILKADAASSSNAELFGLHVQSLATPWPGIGFGGFRLYSNLSDGMTRWALLNKAKGTYDFSVLDSWLAKLYSHGVTNVVYTFSQVPKWASSNPTDTACDFATSSPLYGGCDLPTDINPDGSGTDATYINFVTALAQHVNNPTYLQTHAQIKYWEPWNEWLRNDLVNTSSWAHISVRATYAQMVRMAEDARCIITGTGSVNGVRCTAMPIDTTAKIVSPSDGGQDCCGSAGVFQNFLYCNGAGKNAPIPGSECTTGSRGSAAVDIINTHFYEAAGLPPENLGKNVQQYKALLSATDLAKPLWSTEGSWGKDSAVTDPDVQASWVARYYLMGWSSGLAEMYWYAYDSPTYGQLWTSSGGLNLAGVAYGQVYIWIVNSTLTTPCSATGTVWTCGFTLANGKAVDAIWDTSQTCSDGNCATSKQSVSSAWTNYQDLTGTTNAITNGTVPVGIKPILLTSSAP